MRLSEIADRLGCRLVGADVEIRGVCGIEEAQTGDLTFVANRKYISKIKSTLASAIILAHDAPETAIPSLRTDNPYLAFARSIELFYQPPPPPYGIHPSAVISPTAKIGRNPGIGAHVVIADDVFLGDNVRLYPNVSIYTGAVLGDDCIIHANTVIREYVRLGHRVIVQNGAVIGGDGFGFARQHDGTYYKIVQSGTVIIEDDVEIGANTTVDRATVGATLIKRGAKLDNLVHVGHGCVIGENTLMAAQVGLAGSTKVGRNVMLGGQVGAAGHLTIGDNAGVTAQSGLPHDVESNTLVSGSPAIDHALWRKASALYGKLPELVKRLRALEDEISKLKQNS